MGKIQISGRGNHTEGEYKHYTNDEAAGYVRVFRFTNNSDWEQIGSTIQGKRAGDASGTAMALSSSGLILAIGSKFNGGNGWRSGHVRMFEVTFCTFLYFFLIFFTFMSRHKCGYLQISNDPDLLA